MMLHLTDVRACTRAAAQGVEGCVATASRAFPGNMLGSERTGENWCCREELAACFASFSPIPAPWRTGPAAPPES
jgi:hypothetical protein